MWIKLLTYWLKHIPKVQGTRAYPTSMDGNGTTDSVGRIREQR